MKKGVFIPAFAVLVFIGGVTYVSKAYFGIHAPTSAQTAAVETPAAQVQSPYVVPDLTQPYKNDHFHFSLMMPAGFTAAETDSDGGGKTIVLQDTSDNGIQITVTPFDENIHSLTEERIHQDVPDLAITDPQPVDIGDNDTGLAFESDNPAFDGASRDVWFVFRGNLYQISTYKRLDPLLKAMFSTWKFF